MWSINYKIHKTSQKLKKIGSSSENIIITIWGEKKTRKLIYIQTSLIILQPINNKTTTVTFSTQRIELVLITLS